MKTVFGIEDDLQEFAERWLSEGRHLTQAKSINYVDGVLVSCLYRDSKFQVELCCAPPRFVIPNHTHPNADTIEVPVYGVLRLHVNGIDIYDGVNEKTASRMNRGVGVRINHNDIHGTTFPVGEGGAIFLSVQSWNGSPKSVLTDYVGSPLGEMHRRMK